MKLFVIHRFKDTEQAILLFKKSGQAMAVKFDLIFLDSTGCETWKEHAIDSITNAEAVIIYDRKSCEESENAIWEIKKAEESQLPIIDISSDDNPAIVCSKLKPLYNLEEEFGRCFKESDGETTLDLSLLSGKF